MISRSISSSSGHSPPIRISLEIGNEKFPVAELAPSYLVLRSSRQFGPVRGTVVMNVDGKFTEYPVMLPQGIDPNIERQPLIDTEASPRAEAV